mgnify:CR=1
MNEPETTPIFTHMSERIAAELKNIKAAKGVRVLYAHESGSRAWRFASEDSDYDVREALHQSQSCALAYDCW